jgi:hypothetical protein
MAKSLRSQLYRAARDLGNLEATRRYLKRWIRATGQAETVQLPMDWKWTMSL